MSHLQVICVLPLQSSTTLQLSIAIPVVLQKASMHKYAQILLCENGQKEERNSFFLFTMIG